MPEEPITFEFIRKIQREEQREPKLSKLPEDFYQKAKDYLEQKRKLYEKKGDKGVALEVRNAERLLEDIFNRRETKIVTHAIITARTDLPPPNLLPEEKEMFEAMVEMIKKRRERVLNTLLKKTKEEKFEEVIFMEDVPEFIGADMKGYGPFKKGEKARIPRENAMILISAKKAKRE